MTPNNLDEANQLILSKIGGELEPLILGFLPLSVAEEDAVLREVKNAHRQHFVTIDGLLRTAPAATAYALAVSPSRTLTEGGHFWPALERDLNLDVPVTDRPNLAAAFRRVCARLHLLDGTLAESGRQHVAPFIFQAGILHYWIDALVSALRVTLKHVPPPDIEDPSAVHFFTKRLLPHVHNQPTLTYLLKTEVGPLLIKRLVQAYSEQDWEVLPPHLQEPIKDAFSESGRGQVLRSPFVTFDAALKAMQLVLPAVPSLFAGPYTSWQVMGRKHAARRESRIPLSEFSGEAVTIKLCDLESGFEGQIFSVEAALDKEIPYRVFRADTGREIRISCDSTISLSPGSYWVVMSTDVRTNDEDYVQDYTGFRVINIELRPGGDPLKLMKADSTWVLRSMLLSGIYVDHDRVNFALLEDDSLIHYGGDLGLISYFPAQDFDESSVNVIVRGGDDAVLVIEDVESPQAHSGVFIFHENLRPTITKALDQLTPGIHQLSISLAHGTGRVDRVLWYWKGLDSISLSLGLSCSQKPSNLNSAACKGLVPNAQGFAFQENYNAPFVTLSLTSPKCELKLKRAGIHVVLAEPGEVWEDELDVRKPVVVGQEDKRILRFQSGGFQVWEIVHHDRVLRRLDRKHTTCVVSLAGITSEIGGAGQIRAKAQDGTVIPLLSLTRPLTASAPKHNLVHAENAEAWKFQVPIKEGCEIGVSITDLSQNPLQKIGSIETIAAWHEGETTVDEIRWGAAVIVITGMFDTGPDSEKDTETKLVRVKSTHAIDALDTGLWAIDFYHRKGPEGDWMPLDCVEKHGYSTLRLFAWGDRMPEPNATWWPRLRRANRPGERDISDSALGTALGNLETTEFDIGLQASCSLLNWKYPSAVWHVNARRLQDLPVYLGRYRFNFDDQSAALWWSHATTELSHYASQSATPVVRQFLFASQPSSLRSPRHVLNGLARHSVSATAIERALRAPAQIHTAGSLREWVLDLYSRDEINNNVIICFENFREVQSGNATEFAKFSLNIFLSGGTAGVPGLAQQAILLNDAAPRLKVTALLSPEHLLQCVRKLNRRCRPIEQVAQSDDMQTLSSITQCLERMSQQLDRVAPEIGGKLGWDGWDNQWWLPPLLETPSAEKVAGIIWAVAAICRLAANNKLTSEEFESKLERLLCVEDKTSRTLQKRLCVLLSIAPELFAFYIALFELTIPALPHARTN